METIEKILTKLSPTDPPAAMPIWSRIARERQAAKKQQSEQGTTQPQPSTIEEPQYRCSKCRDLEFVPAGDGAFTFCECRKQRMLERRIKSSHIDPAFTGATFKNYKLLPHNTKMLAMARKYVAEFQAIRKERNNSLGFLAKMGESSIKEIRDPVQRAAVKAKHNSYGLGKTHLLSAVALTLLHSGVQVLLVNDADIVAELRQGQFAEDNEHFEKLIGSIERVELLIWDDLGKAKTTEWVLNQYYRIINYRYRMGLPTCFTSNEDMDTLAEKIGDATASRLFAMCRGRLLRCEGPDYRLA
ncbi:ATP-binding protein [Desulfotomaculum nigrificans]|uniref:ATP-binding protein n=1 Tax=Desulfotomaculum nigrificans TaxID=1565 RepID=UPI001FA7C3D9|nr:ATP-binding protein [Desulfotomaculum nigrificans]